MTHTHYTRKPTNVLAFQYDRQAKKDWPQWLQDYEIATPMGFQGVGAGAGVLLIPTKNGPTINVTAGEWIVYENAVKVEGKWKDGILLVFRKDLFDEAFDAHEVEEGYDEWLEAKVAKSMAQMNAGQTISGEDANARAREQLAEITAKAEAPVVGADPAADPAADAKGGKKKPAGDKPAEDAPAAE